MVRASKVFNPFRSRTWRVSTRRRGHFVPDYVSEKATVFGKKLLDPGIVAELEHMKDKAKEVLGLGRRGVDTANDGEAGGSVDTDFFSLFNYYQAEFRRPVGHAYRSIPRSSQTPEGFARQLRRHFCIEAG